MARTPPAMIAGSVRKAARSGRIRTELVITAPVWAPMHDHTIIRSGH